MAATFLAKFKAVLHSIYSFSLFNM